MSTINSWSWCRELDGVKRNESGLASTLLTKILNAIYSGLFILHYDSVKVASEHSADSSRIALFNRLAKFADSAFDARKDALKIRGSLP